MRRSACLTFALMTALVYSAWAQAPTDHLDEIDGWLAVGDGISVERVTSQQAPEGVEGAGAIRCGLDAMGRTQLYLRCPVAQHDLTGFSELRFRLYGELQESIIPLVTLIDSQWRHRQWLPPAMRVKGSVPQWTEFAVALDSPGNDHGADLRDIQWITWFIIIPTEVAETGGFYLDGVRFTARPGERAERPGPEQVVLSGEGFEAVFDADRRYELSEVRQESGETIEVTTDSALAPLEMTEDGGTSIRIGGDLKWREVNAGANRLSVEYDLGGYRVEKTFTLENGLLRIDRDVTALESGITSFVSRPQIVRFAETFSRVSYEHGEARSATALPSTPGVELPGNWMVASGDTDGVAIVFPHAPFQRATVEGAEFAITDVITRQRTDVPDGSRMEYTIWLRPAEAKVAADVVDATAAEICADLVREESPLRAYFAPRHQPFSRDDRTLNRTPDCAIWQASVSRAVGATEPAPDATDERVRISAARGEVEPIHLVVRPERAMGRVTAVCSELRSEAGTIPAAQWRVRYASYMNVRPTTEPEQQGAEKPEWAAYVGVIENAQEHLHTDRFYASKARALGAIEDPLFDAPPGALEAGRNQPLWLTVSVPEDATPGDYSGEIVLREGEQELARIPVELRVWSFALPRVTSLRTWYQLWQAPTVDVDWNEYYRDLAEHKVSGFGTMAEPRLEWVDGKVEIDWSVYDEAGELLFDELGMRNAKFPHGKRGGNGSNVYPFLGFQPGTPEFERAYEDYLAQAREHLEERGWLEGLDCYIFDEPDHERIEVIKQVAPVIRRTIPDMRIFPACAKNTLELIGVLNAWCPPVNHFGAPIGDFTEERIEAGRARSDVYWWYNQDDNAIGCPVVTHRALLWASWKEDLTGYFVWAVTYWGTRDAKWVSPYEIGDAMAIYPGLEGPVDSIRWEQTREGLEDYEYLVMLERAMADDALAADEVEEARAIIEQARALFPDPRSQLAADPNELLEIRRRIGELLDAAEAQ